MRTASTNHILGDRAFHTRICHAWYVVIDRSDFQKQSCITLVRTRKRTSSIGPCRRFSTYKYNSHRRAIKQQSSAHRFCFPSETTDDVSSTKETMVFSRTVTFLVLLAIVLALTDASPAPKCPGLKGKWPAGLTCAEAKEEEKKSYEEAEKIRLETAEKQQEEAEKKKKEEAEARAKREENAAKAAEEALAERRKRLLLEAEEKRKAAELAKIAQTEAFKDAGKDLVNHLDQENGKTKKSCSCKSCYLGLSDGELFQNLINGHKVGACHVSVTPDPGTICYMYAKSGVRGDDSDYGWPKYNVDGGLRMGSGCVMAPDEPKDVKQCWYRLPSFKLPYHTMQSFCTQNGKYNAVQQIRHAINSNACKLKC